MSRSQGHRLRRFEAIVDDFDAAELVARSIDRLGARNVRSLLLASKALLEKAPLFEEVLLAQEAHGAFSCEAIETREDLEEMLERARMIVLARSRPLDSLLGSNEDRGAA